MTNFIDIVTSLDFTQIAASTSIVTSSIGIVDTTGYMVDLMGAAQAAVLITHGVV